MSPTLADTLYTAVADFVAGRLSLRALRERTTPAIYTADETGDRDAAFLADELVLRFAEADHGDWGEEALRELLGRFLRDAFYDRPQPDPGKVFLVHAGQALVNVSAREVGDELGDQFIALLTPAARH